MQKGKVHHHLSDFLHLNASNTQWTQSFHRCIWSWLLSLSCPVREDTWSERDLEQQLWKLEVLTGLVPIHQWYNLNETYSCAPHITTWRLVHSLLPPPSCVFMLNTPFKPLAHSNLLHCSLLQASVSLSRCRAYNLSSLPPVNFSHKSSLFFKRDEKVSTCYFDIIPPPCKPGVTN